MARCSNERVDSSQGQDQLQLVYSSLCWAIRKTWKKKNKEYANKCYESFAGSAWKCLIDLYADAGFAPLKLSIDQHELIFFLWLQWPADVKF